MIDLIKFDVNNAFFSNDPIKTKKKLRDKNINILVLI